MKIEELRNEIDVVNSEILKLFIKQLELTSLVGEERAKEGKGIYDRKREEDILEKITAETPQDMQNYSIEFFRNLISLSKEYYNDNK